MPGPFANQRTPAKLRMRLAIWGLTLWEPTGVIEEAKGRPID